MISYQEHLQMLKDCLSAMNQMRRQRLANPRYNDSYNLAAELSSFIARYERELT